MFIFRGDTSESKMFVFFSGLIEPAVFSGVLSCCF